MKRVEAIGAGLILASIVGCTNMTPQQQGTVSGAAIGGAAGAGIAALAGGSAWTGLAIGAAAGGVAGHLKGNQQN
jgi:osmotically inducible lipoprotein OsmB